MFDREFAIDAQEKSVFHTLFTLLDMVLCGPSVKRHSNAEVDGRKAVALSIKELIIYNVAKKSPTKPETGI